MDVVLWNDMPNPPLQLAARSTGVYKIAGFIRKYNYSAQVIDFVTSWTEEQLWDLTTHFVTEKTMVLGISMTHIYHAHHLGDDFLPPILYNVLIRLKERYPNLKVVLGGHIGNKFKGSTIVDSIVSGPGEDIFLELLDHYKKGNAIPKSRIVEFPNNNETIEYHASNEQRYNIETDNFKFSLQDGILPNETLPIEVSRGCIFKCKFCQFNMLGKKKLDYIRSMNLIKEEMLYNYDNFGITNYYVVCDTFNDTVEKLTMWSDMLATLPFKINYTAYIRADLLYTFPETPYMLKESGLIGAMHGIESLHPKASMLVGKGWSGKHAKEWLPKLYHEIWNKEVSQHLNFIVGLPYDTEENLRETVQWYNDNELHSIKFTPLGFFSSPLAWTTSSEFNKNSAKYGFEIDVNGSWRNKVWNTDNSTALAKELENSVRSKVKLHPWTFMHLLGLGYDKNTLMTTPRKQFNWDDVKDKNSNFLVDYFNKLKTF